MADSSLGSVMDSVIALRAVSISGSLFSKILSYTTQKLAEQRAAAHAARATESSKNDPRLV